MIEIDNVIISREVFEKHFSCDLNSCKGACCVEGDEGAPLEVSELDVLDEIYDLVKPYMRKEGIEAVEKQGKYKKDQFDNEWVTPLVNNKECAYAIFEDDGKALCAIQRAYMEEKIDFPKPISCDLYPIRIQSYKDFDAVNYDKWDICAPACKLGKLLKMPVFKFAEMPLKRKYGDEWFKKVEEVSKLLPEEK